jgi:RND superfamily putative drug exporter
LIKGQARPRNRLALASAVFLDAFVIRCIMLPVTLQLLGETAWWSPTLLDVLPLRSRTPEQPAPLLDEQALPVLAPTSR